MTTVFPYCAAIGGALLVVQFLLLLFGAGGDHDLSGDFSTDIDGGFDTDVGHDQGSFLKLFSVQTVTTFATFFGLIGLGTEQLGWSPTAVAVAAGSAGVAALWLVAKLMRGLASLQSQGNVDLARAVGQRANVYLRIPAAGTGRGRVMLQVQNRTVECQAITRGAEIPTGTPVRVVEHQPGDVLIVETEQ